MEAHLVKSGRLRDVGVVVVLVALHLGIVASVAFDERPAIWPLHNDTIHRVGRGADFYAVYHAAMTFNRAGGLRRATDFPDPLCLVKPHTRTFC